MFCFKLRHSKWSSDRFSSLGELLPLHPTDSLQLELSCRAGEPQLTDFFCSGTGYIGSFTTLALLEADYKVVIVDNLYNSSPEVVNRIELICGKRPAFYQADITDEAALDKVFAENPDIDNVIHFAALKVRIYELGSYSLPY